MKTQVINKLKQLSIVCIALFLSITSHAQTAQWDGGAADGLWNSALNWDTDIVPGVLTNTIITNVTVNYNTPMSAASIGTLQVGGTSTLNINAGGFVINEGGVSVPQAILVGTVPTVAVATLNLNAGANVLITNSGPVTLSTNAVMNISNATFTTVGTIGTESLNVGLPGGAGSVLGRNNGAVLNIANSTVTLDQMLTVICGGSSGNPPASMLNLYSGTLNCNGNSRINNPNDDSSARIVVNGGIANLGSLVVQRTSPTGGLTVSNGIVNLTGLTVDTGQSRAFLNVWGGIVTNTGVFTIGDRANAATTGDRRAFAIIRGGEVYSTGSEGIVLSRQGNPAPTTSPPNYTNIASILEIQGGTVTAEGVTLVPVSNTGAACARLHLVNNGSLYLGSVGLVANNVDNFASLAIFASAFCTNGLLGAKDAWTGNAEININSGFTTIKAADVANVPHNITLNGAVNGSGVLIKGGGGTLTLNGTNTYPGNTLVTNGTLAIGANGLIASTYISLDTNTVYNVSAVSGYTLNSGQSLGGHGSVNGAFTAGTGSALRPGSNQVAGTLTFTSGLTQTGGANNNFDLTTTPGSANNDLIVIQGNLNLSGVNIVNVTPLGGSLQVGGSYKLFQYTGSVIGDVTTTLSLSGATGIITNDTTAKIVYLKASSSVRAPTNVVWNGSANASSNIWDTLTHSNWLVGAALDYFVTTDSARFNSTGSTHPIVTVAGSVSPASILVDGAVNYTLTGAGSIDGFVPFTVSNNATLKIETVNSYTGVTTVRNGATLEVTTLANGNLVSPIGASGPESANLQFNDGTLSYSGDSITTDRGATLTGTNTINVTNDLTILEIDGSLTGTGALRKLGGGTLTLTAPNSYTNSEVQAGTLRLNTTASGGFGVVTLSGGTLQLAAPDLADFPGSLSMNVTAPSTLTTSPFANRWVGAISGSATLNVSITGPAMTFSGNLTNFTGTFQMGASVGTFRLNSSGGGLGANSTYGSPNATFDLGTGTVQFINRNASTNNDSFVLGALFGGPSTSLSGAGGVNGPSPYRIGDKGIDSLFQGTIQDASSLRPTLIEKSGAGTFILEGNSTYTGQTTVSGGTLALTNNGTINNSTNIQVNAGAVLDVVPRSDGTLTLGGVQNLSGNGTVRGSVTVGSGTFVSPGTSIGRLFITNVLQFQSGSTFNAELQKTGGITNDSVYGLASVQYAGTLNLIYSDTLTGGESFKLFNAGSYSGAFDAIVPSEPAPGLAWNTNNLAVNGTISVVIPGATQIASITRSGNNIVLAGTGPTTGSYFVLSTTNLALPKASWNSTGAIPFNPDGTFAYTNAFGLTNKALYYLIQIAP